MEESNETIAKEELDAWVIYSLFLPAVRLARIVNMPLKEIKHWLSLAYLQEMKRVGHTQAECADSFGVSRRTIIGLSKRLKDNFFRAELASLSRRVLFLLWSQKMSEGRLFQALGDFDREDVKDVIEGMVLEGVIKKIASRTTHYELEKARLHLFKDDWLSRIDALNHQLTGLSDAILSRFYKKEDRVFVRTVGLTIRKEDEKKVESFYKDTVLPMLQELDEASRGVEESELYTFSLLWAPKEKEEKERSEK